MFVAQETGDTFRVFRQAEASVKRAGSARHTRRGTGASCALRLLRAGLRSPQKREKKTTPILQAARTEEQIKVVYLLSKEIA